MKKPAKILRADARMVEGRLCLVFAGRDGAGRPVEMAVPAEGLNAIFSDAQTRLTAFQAQQDRQEGGEYFTTLSVPGTPCAVGSQTTTDGEKVVVVVRRGRPDEQTLRFDPSDARALAEDLVGVADRLAAEAAQKPKPN